MRRVELPAYEVVVGEGALDTLPAIVGTAVAAHRICVVTDHHVLPLHASRVATALGTADVLSMAPGERHKTRDTWAQMTDDLLARGFGRDSVLVAVGGGVVGDIAGFVAATYMRGVPVVQVPTTLLAMVDASVGGKTGVDTPAGKNLVGAFHQPAAVVIDPTVLETLPPDHVRAGFAEILKHGVVADASYFARAERFVATGDAPRGDGALEDLIARSVEIKASIVARDERESGLRKVLNFGHTIGHAVEAATDFAVLHGHAVAIGMVAEARIAERLGVAEPGTAAQIEAACGKARLDTRMPDLPADRLLALTRADKKARAGRVEYALPSRIGAMAGGDRAYGIPVDDDVVCEAIFG